MAAQQLIPVFTGELFEQTTQYCNARDLHASLQVGRDFSNWIKGRIEEYSFVEDIDFVVFETLGPKAGRGKIKKLETPDLAFQDRGHGGARRSIDYHLTMDMAKELAMIENNEIGRAVRRYFIQAEKELRQRIVADLEDKAQHVLPVRGVKLMRDGLSMKDTLRLQDQSQKVLRMIMTAQTKAERKNLHLHFRQINLTLGVPTIDLDAIEAELSCG